MCCRYRSTSFASIIGRFISWVVFVFGGVLVFGEFAFFFFFHVRVVVGDDRSYLSIFWWCVCVLFVVVVGRIFLFGVGQLFVCASEVAIGEVLAVVISSCCCCCCCCCCFSKSNNPKRVSQNLVPSISKSDDKSFIQIPRTVSLVS